MSDYLDPNNEELLKDFFVEAQSQIDLLEQNILVLERNPQDYEAVDEIFRAAHTLKGAAATVEMDELTGLTHVIEDVLDRIRSRELDVDEAVIDVLLNGIDTVKTMLEARTGGTVYDEDISDLRARLEAFRGPGVGAKPIGSRTPRSQSTQKNRGGTPHERAAAADDSRPGSAAGPQRDVAEEDLVGLSEYELLEIQQASGSNAPLLCVSVHFNEDNPMNTVGGIQVYAALREAGEILKTTPELDRLYEDEFYPVVDYYISSHQDPETIKKTVTLPDVTLEIIVKRLGAEASRSEGVLTSPEDTAAAGRAPRHTPAVSAAERGNGPVAAGAPRSESAAPPAQKNGTPPGNDPDQAAEQHSDGRHQVVAGSMLRVDSKRIDNLLNLVSETVINKAAFNQINTQFTDGLSSLQNAAATYRQQIRELLDWIPELVNQNAHDNGSASRSTGGSAGIPAARDVRREISNRFGELLTIFDPVDSALKSTAAKLRNNVQNLTRITSDLQEGVMRIRMVPISQVFSRFPRLVRDLSRTLNKKIELVIEGEDTELDKSVIEDLLDPLIHCVRNSIDHGIEEPNDRTRAGKSDTGRLLLRAANEGNTVVIEVQDDGRGIDAEKVRARAVERGLIHPSKVLSDVEVFNLIFEPGFSTAKVVTNISGRGVGLDVVRKQIEKLSGTVTVSSDPGQGTRFSIRIPLTLAIIQGLLVRVGSEMYAIPISSVIESHRIRPSEIRMLDNYEVFNVREDVISLLRLNRLFRIPTTEHREHYFVVIVSSGERRIGLVVDTLIGEEDVVIKPLRDQYTASPGIAGANITGDGTVCLIIDVARLVELGLRREREERRKRQAVIG